MAKPKSNRKNVYFLLPNEALLLCPDPEGKFHLVSVDHDDLERVLEAGFWRVRNFYPKGHRLYAYLAVYPRNIYLHRFIMNPPPGMVVDHINHHSLDNRKSQMRSCTHAQNLNNPVNPDCYREAGQRRHMSVQ